MSNNLYNENSIQSLDPREFCRLRPGVYAGDTTYATQLASEIFANALDEYVIGNGKVITVEIDKDVVSVTDEGQGFLINKIRPEDGKTIFEASLSVMNTSGKYDSETGVYQGTSLGLNGMGSKLSNFLYNWRIAETHRDGQYEKIWFVEGLFDKREVGSYKDNTSGTTISWKPSPEFFTHTEVELDKLKKLFNTIACLNPGLTINLIVDGKKTVYFSQKGLTDLADQETKGKEIINNRLVMNYTNNKNKIDLILTYTGNYSSIITAYVNNGATDSGPHLTQVKTLITREFNKFFRDKKWLKEKDENLSGDDIQEGLYVVFSITAPDVGYDAQTKSRIVKLDMAPFTGAIADNLRTWLSQNEKDVKAIADKALNARKAREAAKKARDAIRDTSTKKTGLKNKMAMSNKFIDCINKDPSQRNLLLVEGLSAGSSAVEARNNKTDAIYMLRGKTVSPLKTPIDKILANQEMHDIVATIGAGIGDTFDINKMNYNKIVITSDQDSDGMNIELLLTTFFYTYMRPLVEQGKLYRAITPLYIMRQKDKEFYAYSDDELEVWKSQHPGTFDLVRAKG